MVFRSGLVLVMRYNGGKSRIAKYLAPIVNSDRAGRVLWEPFFEQEPRAGLLLYCDPPYAGTQGYSGVASFDQEAFRARCLAWAGAGSIVYISEYSSPIGSLVWERASTGTITAGSGAGKKIVERLYRLAP